MNSHKDLKRQVEQQARRMKKAESERSSLLSQTVFIGTLGLLFVTPMVAGAFLGSWIDAQRPSFSSNWTLYLILIGTLLGCVNACLFIRRNK